MLLDVNGLAIVVSAILAVAVGSIWYSPLLFGTVWMRSMGKTLEQGELSQGEMLQATGKSVLLYAVFYYILAQCLAYTAETKVSLVMVGSVVTLLLATQLLSPVIWERRPATYFLVHAGYVALVVFGGLAIIAYWPW
jgi:hypothetical protein